MVGLIILGVITVGVETHIDRSLVASSGLLGSSLLGWQLIYILPVAILTNDFFVSGFWMRTFASKTDKDLLIGTSIATIAVACILTLVGATGLLAAWTDAWPGDPPQSGSIAFFLLLEQLPGWVVGIVLVMTVSLSTAAFDSLQSAMVSTGSNDLFRNKLGLWWIRAAVVLVIFPVVVVALKSPSVLQVYLISDLVSASSIPVLVIGLSSRCYWWRGFEVVVGGLGGLLTVFIFGTIYFGNAQDGANLLLLQNGLYAEDWSAFGMYNHRNTFDIQFLSNISDPTTQGRSSRLPLAGYSGRWLPLRYGLLVSSSLRRLGEEDSTLWIGHCGCSRRCLSRRTCRMRKGTGIVCPLRTSSRRLRGVSSEFSVYRAKTYLIGVGDWVRVIDTDENRGDSCGHAVLVQISSRSI